MKQKLRKKKRILKIQKKIQKLKALKQKVYH